MVAVYKRKTCTWTSIFISKIRTECLSCRNRAHVSCQYREPRDSRRRMTIFVVAARALLTAPVPFDVLSFQSAPRTFAYRSPHIVIIKLHKSWEQLYLFPCWRFLAQRLSGPWSHRVAAPQHVRHFAMHAVNFRAGRFPAVQQQVGLLTGNQHGYPHSIRFYTACQFNFRLGHADALGDSKTRTPHTRLYDL